MHTVHIVGTIFHYLGARPTLHSCIYLIASRGKFNSINSTGGSVSIQICSSKICESSSGIIKIKKVKVIVGRIYPIVFNYSHCKFGCSGRKLHIPLSIIRSQSTIIFPYTGNHRTTDACGCDRVGSKIIIPIFMNNSPIWCGRYTFRAFCKKCHIFFDNSPKSIILF